MDELTPAWVATPDVSAPAPDDGYALVGSEVGPAADDERYVLVRRDGRWDAVGPFPTADRAGRVADLYLSDPRTALAQVLSAAQVRQTLSNPDGANPGMLAALAGLNLPAEVAPPPRPVRGPAWDSMFFVVHHWTIPVEGGTSEEYGVLGPFSTRDRAEDVAARVAAHPGSRVAQVMTGPQLGTLAAYAADRPNHGLPARLVRALDYAVFLWRFAPHDD